jgi:hypothetical protein
MVFFGTSARRFYLNRRFWGAGGGPGGLAGPSGDGSARTMVPRRERRDLHNKPQNCVGVLPVLRVSAGPFPEIDRGLRL